MRKPEEFIIAVIGILWVILSYFIADYLGAPTQTTLLISVLSLLWVIVAFIVWQRQWMDWIWPVFLALLVACWWPLLDWLAIKDIILPSANTDTIVIAKPWYDTWTFKIILSLIPMLLGYAAKWRLSSARRARAVGDYK